MPMLMRDRGAGARCPLIGAAVLFGCVAQAAPARAELVYFLGGRTMSVKAHRVEDGRLVLDLRGGGQIVCDAAIVARIAPDEIPYPEPQALLVEPQVAAIDTHPEVGTTAREVGATAYDSIISRASAAHGVDARLVHAVIKVESAYQERARSAKGAMGLMQLMPATARLYAVADPYDPVTNIDAGVKYLRSLLDRFPLKLALAAYNAGAGAVERFRGVPPYPETGDYVRRILEQLAR